MSTSPTFHIQLFLDHPTLTVSDIRTLKKMQLPAFTTGWFHIQCSASHQTAGDDLDVCGGNFPPQGYFLLSLIRAYTVVLIKPQF